MYLAFVGSTQYCESTRYVLGSYCAGITATDDDLYCSVEGRIIADFNEPLVC